MKTTAAAAAAELRMLADALDVIHAEIVSHRSTSTMGQKRAPSSIGEDTAASAQKMVG